MTSNPQKDSDTIKIAKVAVFNNRGELLLLRRSDDDPLRPGGWDLPGGEVDAGEDFAMAAAREAREEAGLELDTSDFTQHFEKTVYEAKHRKKLKRHLYAVRLKSPVHITLSHEHAEYAWLPLDQAMQQFQHPVYSLGLEQFKANL